MEKINTFLNNIPAAIYVLIGIIISGLFSVITVCLNNKYNKELKIIDNKNTREYEIFNKRLTIFIEFLDRRSKLHASVNTIFSDIYILFDNVLNSIYKLKLLIPEKKEDLDKLKDIIIQLVNEYVYLRGIIDSKGLTSEQLVKKEEINQIRKKFQEQSEPLIDYLSEKLATK